MEEIIVSVSKVNGGYIAEYFFGRKVFTKYEDVIAFVKEVLSKDLKNVLL